MHLALDIALMFLGAYFIYAAARLSLLYNGLTSGPRERRPEPDGMPEWQKRNTVVLTWMFRIGGLLLIIRSILLLIVASRG